MGKKTKEELTGVTYKTSRISYIHNYIIVALILIILIIILPSVNFNIWWHYAGFFGLLLIAAGLVEEPEWERIMRRYVITNNEIIKIEGLITKKRWAIPYQTVADIQVKKGIIGRILNFGTVSVSSFKEGGDIIMKGMKNPDEIYYMVDNKINLLRKKWMSEGSSP